MPLSVPLVGEEAMLRSILSDDLLLRLFTNNVTPAHGDTAHKYREPSIQYGYEPIRITGGMWRIRGGEAECPEQFFGFTGPEGQVYGYFVAREDGTLLWSERFVAAPWPIVNRGDQVRVRPRLMLSDRERG